MENLSIPRPEHPRPDFQRDTFCNLNGQWQFAFDDENVGLQEGWYAPGNYKFDYSHVWAGTPTYQLPSKIMRFEIVEPGMKKIALNPSLYGLDFAEIKMPTPYGEIYVKLETGKEPKIKCSGTVENIEGRYLISF